MQLRNINIFFNHFNDKRLDREFIPIRISLSLPTPYLFLYALRLSHGRIAFALIELAMKLNKLETWLN